MGALRSGPSSLKLSQQHRVEQRELFYKRLGSGEIGSAATDHWPGATLEITVPSELLSWLLSSDWLDITGRALGEGPGEEEKPKRLHEVWPKGCDALLVCSVILGLLNLPDLHTGSSPC